MHPLEREIATIIDQDSLIQADESVIVIGVSGGPDSVGLLHILLALREELGISLVAVYVNHGLRPEESKEEKSFVRSLCEKANIPFECAEVNVREFARQKKISLEHAARDLRYKILRELAAKHKASVIGVGHTANDQVEEVLLRLLRGSGRKGLSGMLSRSHDIIRPLLHVEREKILTYLDEKQIPYCIDSSNTDMRFTRNRVRHALIPYLEEKFDKGVRRALCKVADSLADDEKLLDELAEKGLQQVGIQPDLRNKTFLKDVKIKRKEFVEMPSALQRRVIEKLLWKMDCTASYTHIKKIVEAAKHGRTGSELHLSRGLRVGVQRDYLEFLYPKGRSAWRGKLYKKS